MVRQDCEVAVKTGARLVSENVRYLLTNTPSPCGKSTCLGSELVLRGTYDKSKRCCAVGNTMRLNIWQSL